MAASDPDSAITHLFTYGTLRAGDVRWSFLAPYADGDGCDDSAGGTVYDTGCGYPAAIFDGSGVIHGRTYPLAPATLEVALEVLDAEESSVAGGYHRVVVTTKAGTVAWAYQYGAGLELTPIVSGDWLDR